MNYPWLMDIAWQSICETICLSGPHGISWSDLQNEIKKHLRLKDEELTWPPGPALKYILSLYAGLAPNYQISQFKDIQRFHKDQKLKLLKFIKLEPISESLLSLSFDESSICNLRFYCSNDSLRIQHILNGRPLQLSESSLLALEIISSHHRQGLTQAELARSMGCDPKSVFHWLKCLISNDLIVRTPVASKKSFTYLLVLTRFLDEEILTTSSANEINHLTVVSSKEIRQRIVDILAKAPNQTMASVDVFVQTGLDRLLIKNYRRAATKLNEIGWLEYLFNDQLMGPYCRLFQLKRKPSEGLDLKRFLDSHDKDLKKKDMEIINYNTPRGVDYKPEYPIIHQIINLLTKSFPIPLTTADLSHRLGITRKYLYRLIERIFPPVSSKKVGVIGAEGVGKVADFVGKEKRIKLFIINEEWRNRYFKLFNDTDNHSSDIKSSEHTTLNPNILSIPSTPNSTITQSSLYSSTQSPSDTRTRQLRHQALLAELDEYHVLDVGKELCARLQSRLGDVRFTLDVKTLRRSADILEKEGLLKIVVTSAPTGTKTLLISPNMSVEDQIVKDRVVSIRENVRSGPVSAASQKLSRLKELMQQPDYFVEGSLPLSKLPQNTALALTKFGFIFGVLARAQLFHQFLLRLAQSHEDHSKYFETMPTIFEQIPLGLYCKIIGMVRMSRELFSEFNDENLKLNTKSIGELSESFKEELGMNRKRFQAQTALLLQTLEQLQLIQGEEHFSSIKLKFAFKYKFALEVPLYNFKGEVLKLIKFNDNEIEAFDEFWSGMRKISTDFQAHKTTISIHDSVDSESEIPVVLIPKPILLARYSDSWKNRQNKERDLERSIRKLSLELFSIEKSKRRRTNAHMVALVDSELDICALESIQNLCTEFEVSSEFVTKMLENFKNQLIEREEARRLDKLAAQRSTSFESSDSENEEETLWSNLDIEHLRWSPADRFKLSLAFCILQQPHFLNNNNNPGGVKWQLAAKIFDKPKDPVIIRRQGLKLCKNYDELRKLIEIDSVVRLVMIRKGLNFTDGDACFKEIFDVCEKELNGLYSSDDLDSCVFDNFIISKDYKGNLETFKSRTEHYLSSIDSWIHSRSYRHGLFLNTSGLCHKESVVEEMNSDDFNYVDVLKLRQVLIYSTADFPGNPQFNLETATSHIQSISPESLKKSIDHLVSSGFASKTKGRDKYRLLGFPLAISEFLREIIEEPSSSEEISYNLASFSTLTVNNSTENLSLTGIEELIEEKFAGEIEICDVSMDFDDNDGRFDAPIVIKRRKLKKNGIQHQSFDTDNKDVINGNFNAINNNYHSWNSIQSLKNSIWFSIDGTFLPTLLHRSLNHLKLFIRATPGISLSRLKTFYRPGLEGFEVEGLVGILVEEGLVQIINEFYLQ